MKLIHKIFGKGTITKVVEREDAEPLLFVEFENDSVKTRRFTPSSIKPFLVEIEKGVK